MQRINKTECSSVEKRHTTVEATIMQGINGYNSNVHMASHGIGEERHTLQVASRSLHLIIEEVRNIPHSNECGCNNHGCHKCQQESRDIKYDGIYSKLFGCA